MGNVPLALKRWHSFRPTVVVVMMEFVYFIMCVLKKKMLHIDLDASPVLPEPMLSSLLRRMPSVESAEIHQLVNCPESFTPDMRCLMGEIPSVAGYFVLAGMNSSGLAFAGGAGK